MGCAGSTQLIVEKEVRHSFPGGRPTTRPLLHPAPSETGGLVGAMRVTLRSPRLASLSTTVDVVVAAQTRPIAVLLVVLELPTADIGPDPRALVLRGRHVSRARVFTYPAHLPTHLRPCYSPLHAHRRHARFQR